MTDPIAPTPELVQQWVNQFAGNQECMPEQVYIARAAAQWGADRQLKADAEWLDQNSLDAPHLTITPTGKGLVEAMRSKVPSLKHSNHYH